jgi:hypothetical protein
MYFTKNRVNLYRFVPIFTIFMFRPLQKNFFLTDQILKKKFLQKTLLSCEKHKMKKKILKFLPTEFNLFGEKFSMAVKNLELIFLQLV